MRIKKPTGLTAFVKIIDSTCSKKYIPVAPKHYILNLDKGEGRTTLAEYMSDMYMENGIIPFTGGVDNYLEFCLDGSLASIYSVKNSISNAATWANEYTGIVFADVSKVSAFVGTTYKEYTEFISVFKNICENATVVFFINSRPTAAENKLVYEICKNIPDVSPVFLKGYSKKDLAEIVKKRIEEKGIRIKGPKAFVRWLCAFLEDAEVSSVKDTDTIVDTIMKNTDYDGIVPYISDIQLAQIKGRGAAHEQK